MPYSEVQQRWDSFLAKIEERFHEMLQQTEIILPTLLDYQNFDTLPFSNAWTGMESQAKELIYKIRDTWDEKVSESFDAIINSSDEFYAENHTIYYKSIYYPAMDKGLALARKLEKELKSYQVRTFAEAARKIQTKAAEVLSGNFTCSQCKAPLPVKQHFFRSYYHSCEYCLTVNTFEPGSIARNVEHFAMHPLAEEKALNEYFIYWDLEESYKRQRDDEPKHIKKQQVVDAYKVYVEKYLNARIEVIPDYRLQYEKDLEAKVEFVAKYLR